jgi:hypothetical protein
MLSIRRPRHISSSNQNGSWGEWLGGVWSGFIIKILNKEDQVVIVGGPGNSLDRNLNYQIEKDISDIAQRTSLTNVNFVIQVCK